MVKNPHRIDIGTSTILKVIAVLVGLWFLYVIRDLLLILLAAVVLSAAIEPLARQLRRRYNVPRGLSVVLVYTFVLAVLIGVVVLMIPPLVEQVTQLAQQLPEHVDQLRDRLGISVETLQSLDIQDDFRQLQTSVTNVGFSLYEQTRNVFGAIVSLLAVFIIAFYLVIEEDALKKLFRLLVPGQRVAYMEKLIDRVEYKLGGWVLGQLSLALIIGVIVGLGLWIMGVPYALALGLLAGVLEVIPVIGPFIAGLFGVFVALSQSLWLGVAALVFYLVVQQVENNVLVPNIMRRATGLNPLVTLLAVLLGSRLAGLAGVILSVPVATMISIFLSDFLHRSTSDDDLVA